MKKILAITIPILIIIFILCFMFFSPNKEKTLKVKASKEVYVTFAVDNEIYKKYYLNENDELEFPSDPNKEGFEFLYWEIDGEKIDKDITIDKDSTINATFKDFDSKNEEENSDIIEKASKANKKNNVINGQSISLSKTSVTLNVGKTTTLTARVIASNGNNKTIEWSSSNPNVATVNNGKVTAKAHGIATITAKTPDGKQKAICNVEVYETVDLVLMWGQSNMVGRAGKYAVETATNNTSQLKRIDGDIVLNNKSYSRVTVSLASNVAYEYKALTNSLVDISTNPLKFGEKIYYNNKSLSTSPETSEQAFLEESQGTNMIPYFAKEYYKRTGHKLVIVHAASGGKNISSFFPDSTLKLYPAIVKKYQMAETYLKQNNFIVNNKFYVVYQGESDVREGRAQAYETNFLQVHNKLISDLKLSFGAMVYMVRGDMAQEEYLPILRNAQKKMVKENDNLIKGTDWPYSQIYDKNNTSILCPGINSIHLNAAGLSQVGRQIAISVSNSNKIK